MQISVTMMLGALVVLSGSVTCSTLPISGKGISLTNTRSLGSWTGLSNGENVTLYGDKQSIKAQLKALDPDWVAPVTKPMEKDTAEYSSLLARQGPGDHLTCCPVGNWDWTPADYNDMNAAINEVGGIDHWNNYDIPAHSCSEMVNHGAATIYFCNDGDDDLANLAAITIQNAVHSMNGCFQCGQMFLAEYQYYVNVITHNFFDA